MGSNLFENENIENENIENIDFYLNLSNFIYNNFDNMLMILIIITLIISVLMGIFILLVN